MASDSSKWRSAFRLRRKRALDQPPAPAGALEAGEIETLGRVRLPSGRLVIIDFGLMNLWSHKEQPLLSEQQADAAIVDRANTATDYEIIGADAHELATKLDRARVKGTFVFDWPQDSETELLDRASDLIEAHGLTAEIRPIDRMPHAARANALLDQSPTGAEIPFHGPWAVGLAGLPVDVDLMVKGQRMPKNSSDFDRWSSVWVEIDADATIMKSVEAGHVLVDKARLMLCDLDLLREWSEGEPFDGLFDLAFWGRDEQPIAELLGAETITQAGRSIFGWHDLSLDAVKAKAQRIQELKEDEYRFAFDVRPHDHAYAVLRQAWESDTGSGTIDLAGGTGTGLFTSWGDGAFPVMRDLSAGGELVRVRVDFASVYGS